MNHPDHEFARCQAVLGWTAAGEPVRCDRLTHGHNEFCDEHDRAHDEVSVTRDDTELED